MTMMPTNDQPKQNTDRELWRETPDDYYAPRVFVTADGGIGIDIGGFVIVKPVRMWHKLAAASLGTPVSIADASPAKETR